MSFRVNVGGGIDMEEGDMVGAGMETGGVEVGWRVEAEGRGGEAEGAVGREEAGLGVASGSKGVGEDMARTFLGDKTTEEGRS